MKSKWWNESCDKLRVYDARRSISSSSRHINLIIRPLFLLLFRLRSFCWIFSYSNCQQIHSFPFFLTLNITSNRKSPHFVNHLHSAEHPHSHTQRAIDVYYIEYTNTHTYTTLSHNSFDSFVRAHAAISLLYWSMFHKRQIYLIRRLVGWGFGLALRRTSSIFAFKIALISSMGLIMKTGTSSSRRWNNISPSKSTNLCLRARSNKPTNLSLIMV